MLILPERGVPRTKVLLPVSASEWRTPSQAQQKDFFGNENQTRFSATARLHDGHVAWRGWFDDRDDFDAFIWGIVTGSIQYEKALWRLPTPWWHPNVQAPLGYDFLTTSFIVSTNAANQTDSVPSDWNNVSNSVDVIASGASGAATGGTNSTVSGGGGAAWSQTLNVSLTPGGTATFFLNVGGVAVTAGAGSSNAGNNGPDAWYNGTTLLGSSVGAKGGTKGSSTGTVAAGGLATGGVGTNNKTNGGASGSASSGPAASGGGGAGGPNGDGVASANASAGSSAGGNGDASFGGNGGTTAGGAGNPGQEYDSTHGSGGGGGGITSSATAAGIGGNYGAGGGASSRNSALATAAAGKQGLIIKRYTPASVILGLRSRQYLRR